MDSQLNNSITSQDGNNNNYSPSKPGESQEIIIVNRDDSIIETISDKKDENLKSNQNNDSENGTPKYSRWNINFYLKQHRDETKIIAASMIYKFAFETFSSALGLVVLTRFETNGVTFLAVMNIIYFLAQSVGSVLVNPFVRQFRASRVVGTVMILMGVLISILIIVEAASGGTITKLGDWGRYFIVPFYLFMGLFLGMIEVSRKLTPRQILGNDNEKLSKFNGLIHLFYETAGTAGAFLSTALIKSLGPIYALSHQPVFYIVAGICFLFVSEPFPSKIAVSEENKSSLTAAIQEKNPIKRTLKRAAREVMMYFHGLYVGGKNVLSVKYWWILFTYVLPQVLHRLLENLLFPTFAKKVLHDGSLSGILTGGSNAGEAVGSIMVVKFGKKVKNPMWWVRVDGLFCTLVWMLAYPPNLSPVAIACSLIPIFIIVSSSWAAGDISLLSFIQSKFPLNIQSNDNVVQSNDQELMDLSNSSNSVSTSSVESDISEIPLENIKDDKDKKSDSIEEEESSTQFENDISDEDDAPPGSPLASVIGFLYACYAIIISLLSFGLGRVMDHFANQGDISRGFFWIGGVGFTVCGGIIIFTSFFAHSDVRKK
ncbi:hypothetical protein DLAC_09285 [Tieghemostelium lacteum]|uniref:Major facilitator superfamily (MFS) profile domain-containing protein n=1 Tax=Tieghemostelium lacteum TaxID=361077 RepID=A0A151Z9L8_TIELA|nr:hypothetical protein DLAC_09285 [Tieghemostelium lacteum]|eukprot:KYQ90651.1 hypothetical protein DLAC_09285 [Tieghemostelium lacteum]